MKKIGAGWQYTTYEISKIRVLKKFNNPFQSLLVMLKEMFSGKEKFKLHKIPHYIHRSKKMAKSSLDFLKSKSFPDEMMGNPVFFDNLDYEQDMVMSIRDYLINNPREGEGIIDEYIQLLKSMISFGFIEDSFNMGDNYGVTKENKVILVDLGEILNADLINNRISERPWSSKKVSKSIPDDLFEYYVNKMDKNFLN